jgi:hypothetical protein
MIHWRISLPASARLHVVDVERFETLRDAVGQVVVIEEIAKGQCRRGEAGRHAHAGVRQLADHFAKRRVLAADDFNIGHSQLLEWNYIRLILCDIFRNIDCVSHTSP